MAKKKTTKEKVQPIKRKELKLGELWAAGWDIYKKNFKLFALITLIIYVPINIILNLLPDLESFEGVRLYINIANILDFLVGIIVVMAIAYAVDRIINNKKPKLWESFKEALLTWDKAILTSLLAAIILIGLYILLIIPGIIYQYYYAFIVYAVILKKKKYKNALDYSKSLVKGRWWRVLGIFLVVGFGVSILGAIATMIISVFDTFITNVIADSVFDIIYALRDVIIAVFFINLSNIGPKK